nr:TetR/AcrR family transcriptional regulator C-terminal ligand-binding domain-containing protein [Actinomycetota bacterium]
ESQSNGALAAAIVKQFIAARRAMCREVFQLGLARGELRADVDVDIAIDALYGALYYRLLVSHATTEPGYVDNLIEQLYPALTAAPSTDGFPTSNQRRGVR